MRLSNQENEVLRKIIKVLFAHVYEFAVLKSQLRVISDEVDEIKSAAKIILPGVGAFRDSVNILKKKKIFDTIKQVQKTNLCQEFVLACNYYLKIVMNLVLVKD